MTYQLSPDVGYSIPPPSQVASTSKQPFKQPILLRLREELLDVMVADNESSSSSLLAIKLNQQSGEMRLSIAGKELSLAATKDPAPDHFIYSVGDKGANEGAMTCHGRVSLQLSLKSSDTSNAVSKLKQTRQEEADRKQTSRTVLLDQSDFDKNGKLASRSATALAATGRSRSTTPLNVTSPRVSSTSFAKGSASVGTTSPAIGTPKSSIGSPALHSLASSTGSSSNVSGAPSLRQRILHVLAAGPRSRDQIIHSIPTGPEASIIRLLPLLASPHSGKDSAVTGSTLFTLKDELYKEVATSIAASTWPSSLVTGDMKQLISDKAKQAFERLGLNKKAPERKAIAEWCGDAVAESTSALKRPPLVRASVTEPNTKNSSSEQSISMASSKKSKSPSMSPEPSTSKDDSSSSSKKSKTSSLTQRLTRASQGKGPRGDDLKKEQEKRRRKLEKAKAAEEVSSRDDSAYIEKRREAAAEKQGELFQKKEPKKRKRTEERTTEDIELSKVSKQDQRQSHKHDVELTPTASSKAPPSDVSQRPVPVKKRKSEVGSSAERRQETASPLRQRSPPLDDPQHQRATPAADERSTGRPTPDAPAVSANESTHHHHGPSASASLLNAEPWLDVRTSEEWSRLAMRFRRVWTQYSEITSLLEAEKQRLQVERQRAETDQTRAVTSEVGHREEDSSISQTSLLSRARQTQPKEDLEEGEEDPEEGEALDDSSSSLTDDAGGAGSSQPAKLAYCWRDSQEDENADTTHDVLASSRAGPRNEDASAESSRSAPMSLEELVRLVAEQRSRQGELRRMKDALQVWNRAEIAT